MYEGQLCLKSLKQLIQKKHRIQSIKTVYPLQTLKPKQVDLEGVGALCNFLVVAKENN